MASRKFMERGYPLAVGKCTPCRSAMWRRNIAGYDLGASLKSGLSSMTHVYAAQGWPDGDPERLRRSPRGPPSAPGSVLDRGETEERGVDVGGHVGTVFHPVDNDLLLCYSRADADHQDALLIVVNLDAHYRQSGWLQLDLGALGMEQNATFQVHDLMSDVTYRWAEHNYVRLDPFHEPAHLLVVRRYDT